MSPDRKRALLSAETSRRNKVWILCSYGNVEWSWKGTPYESRLMILIDGQWLTCKSYDEDIKPFLLNK